MSLSKKLLFADEASLNAEAIVVINEVDDFYAEVEVLQEDWRKFLEEEKAECGPRAEQFFWSALTQGGETLENERIPTLLFEEETGTRRISEENCSDAVLPTVDAPTQHVNQGSAALVNSEGDSVLDYGAIDQAAENIAHSSLVDGAGEKAISIVDPSTGLPISIDDPSNGIASVSDESIGERAVLQWLPKVGQKLRAKGIPIVDPLTEQPISVEYTPSEMPSFNCKTNFTGAVLRLPQLLSPRSRPNHIPIVNPSTGQPISVDEMSSEMPPDSSIAVPPGGLAYSLLPNESPRLLPTRHIVNSSFGQKIAERILSSSTPAVDHETLHLEAVPRFPQLLNPRSRPNHIPIGNPSTGQPISVDEMSSKIPLASNIAVLVDPQDVSVLSCGAIEQATEHIAQSSLLDVKREKAIRIVDPSTGSPISINDSSNRIASVSDESIGRRAIPQLPPNVGQKYNALGIPIGNHQQLTEQSISVERTPPGMPSSSSKTHSTGAVLRLRPHRRDNHIPIIDPGTGQKMTEPYLSSNTPAVHLQTQPLEAVQRMQPLLSLRPSPNPVPIVDPSTGQPISVDALSSEMPPGSSIAVSPGGPAYSLLPIESPRLPPTHPIVNPSEQKMTGDKLSSSTGGVEYRTLSSQAVPRLRQHLTLRSIPNHTSTVNPSTGWPMFEGAMFSYMPPDSNTAVSPGGITYSLPPIESPRLTPYHTMMNPSSWQSMTGNNFSSSAPGVEYRTLSSQFVPHLRQQLNRKLRPNAIPIIDPKTGPNLTENGLSSSTPVVDCQTLPLEATRVDHGQDTQLRD